MANWRITETAAALYESCQKLALKSRLGIPLLYGIDAVHGHNNVLGAVISPHNIGLGCTGSPEIVEQAAHITAKELRATGVQWAFAPCVAVPRDIRWGRTYEGYSEGPALVASLGLAAYKGVAGKVPLLDQGDARIDEATLRAIMVT